MIKGDLTAADEHPNVPADNTKTGIYSLAIEVFDTVSDIVIRSGITRDPAQTARNISDYKAVSRAFENSVERNSEGVSEPRTKTRQFIQRLSRLGSLARQVHETTFPKEGLSSTRFDVPGSGATRIHAGAALTGFQSEARKAKLVQDILNIQKPGERMNAIAFLIHNEAFEQLAPEHQKPLINEVFRVHLEESGSSRSYIGETSTAQMIIQMENRLLPEHRQQLNTMVLTHRDKFQEIVDARASSIENVRSRRTQEIAHGPKQQIDRYIDHLEGRVKQLDPIEDLGHIDHNDSANNYVIDKNWDIIHETASLSQDISSTYHDARQEILHQERSRDTRGR